MKKKLHHLILLVLMIFLLSSMSYAQDEFAGGSGTEDDPYLIETIENLDNIRHHEGSHFKQISNLDFNNYSDNQEWEPIGEYIGPDDPGFNCVYDGNNKIIRNSKNPLFDSGGKNFLLKNLSLKNVNTEWAALAISNFGTIKNCSVSGRIYGEEKFFASGGLAGLNRGIIKNCSSSIEITINNDVDFIGGLVGWNSGSVFNSNSVGKIIVEGEDRYVAAGGLVGIQSIGGRGHLISSSADVDIFIGLKEEVFAGGLVGSLNSIVENSYAMGNVTGKADDLDELVGLVSRHSDLGLDRGNTYAMGKVINEKDFSTLEEFKLVESINQSELQEQIEDFNLNKRNDKGRTLLHQAAIYNNNPAVIKELIDAGININARDIHGYSPLHFAAQYNNVEVIEVFLDVVEGLEQKEGRGKTPLHLAANYNNSEVVEKLIEAGAEIEATDENNQRALHLAATNNAPKVVNVLIRENAEIDSEGIWNATPLQLAILYNGNLEVIDKLIEGGADIKKGSSSELNQAIGGFDDIYADERTLNPLSLVAYNGHFNYRPEKRLKEVMKMLINAGINVKHSSFDSRSIRNRFQGQPKLEKTILIWSIEYFDDAEFVEFLLEAGAGEDPDIVGPVEGTFSMKALHQAVFNENLEIIKLLIEDYDAGVDGLKYTSKIIKTPLMIAAEKGNEKIVNYLLDAGADGSIEYEGKTAYDYFKENEELKDTDTYWRLNDAQY